MSVLPVEQVSSSALPKHVFAHTVYTPALAGLLSDPLKAPVVPLKVAGAKAVAGGVTPFGATAIETSPGTL